MSSPRVVVFDYGSGNVHSVVRALEKAGADAVLTSDRKQAMEAHGLVVPGVGAFQAVMNQLNAVRGTELIDRRLAGGRAVFGICVGLQVMFERGIERGVTTEGLGEWPGQVTQLDAPILPHIGWSHVEAPDNSVLFRGLDQERFYFVHSNGAQEWSLDPHPAIPRPAVTWAEYGSRFIAAVENGPLMATQFHPEKSGDAGIRLLSHWLGTLG
ncbi:imidazole glycerol phosphate synthase subunit HisH [Lysinibacter sp. HNR]|uniref:imidazole glycerol phosphate synthase subunit HisH n=1 Tax=Lysinibacter sp. HNR TaxID=3031408 RepID=UPI0024352F14|nr:imidazole glycerol phosphate synthase subunit HisH [Lysinibacter sp. HNR]WGD37903.1 imidazole glycerol phosphate synthase subunit HisH [Lysinibacter sp. HNR]